MNNKATYKGRILFNPENLTKKHKNQANWKYMAIIVIDGDVADYYQWFVKKRYDIELETPIRGAHVSFINDSDRDIAKGLNIPADSDEIDIRWKELENKWNGKEINITVDVDAKTSTDHWWLIVLEDEREEMHNIRAEIGLGRPFFGLHMTIGKAINRRPKVDNVDSNGVKALKMNLEQSEYIHNLIKKGLIE